MNRTFVRRLAGNKKARRKKPKMVSRRRGTNRHPV